MTWWHEASQTIDRIVYFINSFLDLSLESSYIIGLFQEMFKARRPLKDEDQTSSEQSLKLRRDKGPGSRQVSEEKNKFALSVLRRVRVKLEGREPDSLRKVGNREICIMFNIQNIFVFLWHLIFQSTVGEQVDFIIREAMNMENLSLMYEGWTAWI